MKLSRLALATLVAYIQQLIRDGRDLNVGDIQSLDDLCSFDGVVAPSVNDLESLLKAHGEGKKIETIKVVRSITGLPLKDSKELVERCPIHIVPEVERFQRKMVDKIRERFMPQFEPDDGHILRHFTSDQLEDIIDFINSFSPHP